MILRFLRSVWAWFSDLRFSNVKVADDDTFAIDPKLQKGKHNCAPMALAEVMPNLSADRILQGFSECCDKWPYGGVTNKEFNITLRHLDLFEKFKYDDSDKRIMKHFLCRRNEVFILLILGHFTVVRNGKIYDNVIYTKCINDKVYCSWRLISD